MTVVINPENDFASDLTIEQLNLIWRQNDHAKLWSDVNPNWPEEEIKLYSPGTDSGTFDYFTEVVIGEGDIRTNFVPSEDENVLVQGVAGDKYAIGSFGYSYYKENMSILKAVAINGVSPSVATIFDGSYTPLSSPLLIYVNKQSYVDQVQVKGFVN